jgi:hypothetical protein
MAQLSPGIGFGVGAFFVSKLKSAAKLLTRDEARRISANVARVCRTRCAGHNDAMSLRTLVVG